MSSIAEQVAERSESLAQRSGRGEFIKLAHMLMKYGGAFEAHAQPMPRGSLLAFAIFSKVRSLAPQWATGAPLPTIKISRRHS